MDDQKYCECCGAKMVEYKHRLNKGLCDALLKLYNAGGTAKICDLGLSKSQYCNFQKLKYWIFIDKVNPDDERGGEWKITSIGINFVEGSTEYERVVTYRGKPIRFEGNPTSMNNIIGDYDYRRWYVENAHAIKDSPQQSINF